MAAQLSILLALLLSQLMAAGQAPPLTNAASVHALSPAAADGLPPVSLTAIVTFHQPGVLLFVQDATAGIYVHYAGSPLTVQAGEAVRVRGTARRGRYSNIIDASQITPATKGPAGVAARDASLGELFQGSLDAQWLRLAASVRTVERAGDYLAFEIVDPPHRLTLRVLSQDPARPERWLGTRIEVEAVAAMTFSARGEPNGFQLLASRLQALRITRPPRGSEDIQPAGRIRELSQASLRMNTREGERARVQGVATFISGRRMFIEDPSGGCEVLAVDVPATLRPGMEVEVIGWPAGYLEKARLEDAVVSRTGRTGTLKPAVLPGSREGRRELENRLVSVEAEMIMEHPRHGPDVRWCLRAGGEWITAVVPRELNLPNAVPGTRLALIGVLESAEGPSGFARLLLRAAEDIRVLAPSPAQKHSPALAVLALAALLASGGLTGALLHIQRQRKRAEHTFQLQAALQAEMRESEQQLRRALEERERIGRDLHDDIIQSIYAVGLTLEHCRRSLKESPETAEPRLKQAIESLNGMIRGVRGFIAGLEPKILNGRELKTALKSLALTSGDGGAQIKIEIDPGSAARLTPEQATQCLRIAKEAISNSLRHGRADLLEVSLQPADDHIRFEIRDNGEGFETSRASGKGRGLSNMAERATQTGARLRVVSAPGNGCSVQVELPL